MADNFPSKDHSLLAISSIVIGIHLCLVVWSIFDNSEIKSKPQPLARRLAVQTITLNPTNGLKSPPINKPIAESHPASIEILPIEEASTKEVIADLPKEEPLPEIIVQAAVPPKPEIKMSVEMPKPSEIEKPVDIQENKPPTPVNEKIQDKTESVKIETAKKEVKIAGKPTNKPEPKAKEKPPLKQKPTAETNKNKDKVKEPSTFLTPKKDTKKNPLKKAENLKKENKKPVTLSTKKKPPQNNPTKDKIKKEAEAKAALELQRKKEAELKALKAQQKSLSEAQERIAKIIPSHDKIPQGQNISSTLSKIPESISKLQIDDFPEEAYPQLNDRELCYRDELKNRLELLLRLPKDEIVKIKLTIESSGKVAKVVVVSAKSEANRVYIEDKLPKMTFPAYGDMFGNAPRYTFPISIND